MIHSNGGQTDTLMISQAANPNPTVAVKQIGDGDVQVYPNPTRGAVYIKVEGNAKLIIYNSTGKQILETEISDFTNEIDLSPFLSGLYLFDISVNNQHVQHLVLKE